MERPLRGGRPLSTSEREQLAADYRAAYKNAADSAIQARVNWVADLAELLSSDREAVELLSHAIDAINRASRDPEAYTTDCSALALDWVSRMLGELLRFAFQPKKDVANFSDRLWAREALQRIARRLDRMRAREAGKE